MLLKKYASVDSTLSVSHLFPIKPHQKLSKNPYVGLVMVMDASSLLPVNRDLANNYV